MQKIALYSLLLTLLAFGSCKKFLAEYSQDEVRPSTVDELASLMYADAYPRIQPIDNFDILTDDVQCNGPAKDYTGAFVSDYLTALQTGTAMFKFDPTMFDVNNTIPSGADVYSICYSKIKGCNVVMDYLAKVSGTDKDKNALRGQCLCLRAYYYLKLVSSYAQPYTRTDINPSSALGVPLVLSSQVKDGGLPRNTLKEVYDQIENDLVSAASLLTDNYTPTTIFRVGNVAAWTLLSRFYLYRGATGDLDKAIQYSTLALAQNASLLNLVNTFNSGGSVSAGGLYNTTNSEIIWAFGSAGYQEPYFPTTPISGYMPPYSISSALYQLYDKGTDASNLGDLRYLSYFTYFGSSPYVAQKFTTGATYGARGLRVAELYLNRAEALVQRYRTGGNASDRQQALSDLNTLRASRYDTRNTAYVAVDIAEGDSLYHFCQDERRRELCLEEGNRFVDIKRWGLSVTHVFTGADGLAVTTILPANSNLYALPIPYTAMNSNGDLVQNPR